MMPSIAAPVAPVQASPAVQPINPAVQYESHFFYKHIKHIATQKDVKVQSGCLMESGKFIYRTQFGPDYGMTYELPRFFDHWWNFVEAMYGGSVPVGVVNLVWGMAQEEWPKHVAGWINSMMNGRFDSSAGMKEHMAAVEAARGVGGLVFVDAPPAFVPPVDISISKVEAQPAAPSVSAPSAPPPPPSIPASVMSEQQAGQNTPQAPYIPVPPVTEPPSVPPIAPPVQTSLLIPSESPEAPSTPQPAKRHRATKAEMEARRAAKQAGTQAAQAAQQDNCATPLPLPVPDVLTTTTGLCAPPPVPVVVTAVQLVPPVPPPPPAPPVIAPESTLPQTPPPPQLERVEVDKEREEFVAENKAWAVVSEEEARKVATLGLYRAVSDITDAISADMEKVEVPIDTQEFHRLSIILTACAEVMKALR